MSVIKTNNKRIYAGVYMGVVNDNQDPKALGRLKVFIPSVLGRQVHKAWAEPCLPSVEVFTIPPVGSQVWVMFEEGDPNRPIWMGCLLKADQPHTEAKNGSPKARSIKTEEALRITLDDNVKEIQIDTGNDAIITLKKVDKHIVIDAENVLIGTNAAEALVRGDTFRALFNSHTHLSAAPGIPTGAPIEQMDPASSNTHLSSKHRVE